MERKRELTFGPHKNILSKNLKEGYFFLKNYGFFYKIVRYLCRPTHRSYRIVVLQNVNLMCSMAIIKISYIIESEPFV